MTKNYIAKRPKLLLTNCLHELQAALEAYKIALAANQLNNFAIRQLLMDHKYALQISLDKFTKYRDILDLTFVGNLSRPVIKNIKIYKHESGLV